ncbi:MAG: hypothetical protein WD187_02810 [Candidatus Woykebacteria bacterium]
MEYLLDYFLFTFFASFGVLHIALAKKFSARYNFGVVILVLSYIWFFGSKNRDIPTMVEGAQLFLVFSVSVLLSLLSTKVFFSLKKEK